MPSDAYSCAIKFPPATSCRIPEASQLTYPSSVLNYEPVEYDEENIKHANPPPIKCLNWSGLNKSFKSFSKCARTRASYCGESFNTVKGIEANIRELELAANEIAKVQDEINKDPSLLNDFGNYKNRVSTFLDLNPKSVNIVPIEEQEVKDIQIQNKIYYGAPGTGKSHKVKELLRGKEEFTERITFHPEYDYASFVGGYKPMTEKDCDTGKDEIKYKFVDII